MSLIELKGEFSAPPAPIIRRRLPKYVQASKNRHGTTVYYFRRNKQAPRIRIRGIPGSSEFLAAVKNARNGIASPVLSWVYFARSGNRVKIGVSKNPRDRISGLRAGSATKIRIYYVYSSVEDPALD